MKKRIIIIVLAGLIIAPAFGQSPSLGDKNWKVVFEDDFSTFNTGRWSKAHGIHGSEPQHYIEENVKVEGGNLVLTAKKEDYNCTLSNCNCNGGTYKYTSGQIDSKVLFRFI